MSREGTERGRITFEDSCIYYHTATLSFPPCNHFAGAPLPHLCSAHTGMNFDGFFPEVCALVAARCARKGGVWSVVCSAGPMCFMLRVVVMLLLLRWRLAHLHTTPSSSSEATTESFPLCCALHSSSHHPTHRSTGTGATFTSGASLRSCLSASWQCCGAWACWRQAAGGQCERRRLLRQQCAVAAVVVEAVVVADRGGAMCADILRQQCAPQLAAAAAVAAGG